MSKDTIALPRNPGSREQQEIDERRRRSGELSGVRTINGKQSSLALDSVGVALPGGPEKGGGGNQGTISSKPLEERDLIKSVTGFEKGLADLRGRTDDSIELGNLLGQQRRNQDLINKSLGIAQNLSKSRFHGGLADTIRRKVAQGFFVSGTRSRSGGNQGPTRPGQSRRNSSSFSVSFGKLTPNLDQLIKRQRGSDALKREGEISALQSQLVTAQSTLDLFRKNNRSAKSILDRGRTAKAQLRSKRGRLSLRVSGAERGLLDDSETTNTLI